MSILWRENYIRTFLERDIPQLGINIPANTLHRFWTMIAHYHGQILNYSELARSFGISDMTVRKYLEILSGTYMIDPLQPWHRNIKKRQVKSPKLYIRDSGLFHSLLRIEDSQGLLSNPKLGASWEGFVIEQIRRLTDLDYKDFYFWSLQSGAEIDLFWQSNGKSYGVEIKYNDAPKLTTGLKSIIQELDLNHLWIVYPGNQEYKLNSNVTVLPLEKISKVLGK